MKFIYKFFIGIAIYLLFNVNNVNAQGCVAIRSNGSFFTMEHPMLDSTISNKSWE
ncbi:MAG: hypothetical protein JWP67_1558, partial [Mucilaginibacter sp.]|nr:hypothetical protein [Mucilaginibacter sp.]